MINGMQLQNCEEENNQRLSSFHLASSAPGWGRPIVLALIKETRLQ